MNYRKAKSYLLLFFLFLGNLAFAQSDGAGSSYLTYALMAVALFLFFLMMIQVSDNLLAIEARQVGAEKKGRNFSIFPSWSEIFAPKVSDAASNEPVTVLRKGHDILLEGAAISRISNKKAKTFAVQPINFVGMTPIPKVVVEVGATVQAGDELFYDKKMPEIKYVAPVSGEVIAINRGEKRSIVSVVILADKDINYKALSPVDLTKASREDLVAFLLESGVWPVFQSRPFNVVPAIDEVPRDIFITTFDSAPLAPDLNFVVAGKQKAFQRGLDVLNKLTTGSVYLGLDARNEEGPSAVFTEAEGVEKRWFHGKHPAGNVGIQIHHTAPISGADKVWTLGVQAVITLGNLFLESRFDAERLVAVTGAELEEPKYIKTFQGASIGDLVNGNLKSEAKHRIISGDVLSGERKDAEGYLDFHDDQITVIEEGDYYEMFGWLLPLSPRPSISNTFPNFLFKDFHFKADTNTHGEQRAFVVTGQYEQVLPMDIYPQYLMKAILINDFERMEGLGITELVEEDVALCEFVCTSKQPLQKILREGLDTMREQG